MPLRKAANWLDNTATGKRLVAAFIVNCFIVLWLIPWSIANWMPGHAAHLLDLKFAYSANEAINTIASLGETARIGYRLFAVTVDFVWPIGYTLLFAWIIALLKRKTKWETALWPFYPLIFMFGFDLLENWSVALMVTLFPYQPALLAWAASAFTTIKWISFCVTLAVVCMMLASWIIAKVAKPRA